MAFDPTDPAQLALLKTEISTDPRTAGLSVDNSTRKNLSLLNRPSNNPSADTVGVPVRALKIIDAVASVDRAEFAALPELDKLLFLEVAKLAVENEDEVLGHRVRLLAGGFGPGTATWAAIKDDRARDASIGEALFGRDTVLTGEDIAAALVS